MFHAFNPSGRERNEPVEIVVWDWPGDVRRMRFAGPSDEALPHQIFEPNGQYWGHKYTRVLVQVSVPPFGHTTLVLKEIEERIDSYDLGPHQRVETSDEFVLENSNVRVLLNAQNGTLVRLSTSPQERRSTRPEPPGVQYNEDDKDDFGR